jgi:hypothetical protein
MGFEAHVRKGNVGGRALAALFCCMALLVPASAGAKPKPKHAYSFRAQMESVSFLKSVCVSPPWTITETSTTLYNFRRSGSGVVAERGELGKGKQDSSGTRTIRITKTVEGPNAADPEHGEYTEQLGRNHANWSPFTSSAAGVRVDLGFPDVEFYSMREMKKGKTKTFSLDKDATTSTYQQGNCTYEERNSSTGDIVVTRTR